MARNADVDADVATRQPVVELDAVEHDRWIAEEDVVEVEISMALTDPPLDDATLEQILAVDEEPVRPVLDVLEAIARDQLPDVALGLDEVLVGVEPDRGDLAEHVDIGTAAGVLVERHENVDEVIEHVGGQLAAFEDPDTEVVVVELLHGDRPVDDLSIALPDRQVLAVESHRFHSEVDVGCEPAVELDLPAAVQLPEFERREVEEPEVDGLLELVRPFAGQQDRRDVRLQVR